jgi:hypothetical protein
LVLPDNGRGDGDCRDPDFPNRSSGILLYAIAFIASLFWAVSDAGWDFWPLFSRLFTFAVLAFLCAIVWPFLRAANSNAPQKARHLASRRCSPLPCWSALAGCLNRRRWWRQRAGSGETRRPGEQQKLGALG